MIEGWEYDVLNQVPFSRKDGLDGSKLYAINTPQEWDAFYEILMSKKKVACDTETSGFRWYDKDRIVGMSFGWNKEHFYVPTRHVDSYLGGEQPQQLDMDVLRPQLQEFFNQDDVFTIWHNAKFDMHFYKADNIDINTPFHDTTFLWHLHDENAPAALKIISSGWTDTMRQRHKGLFGPEAAKSEKEISNWRAAEAKAHREVFKDLVMARADELQTDIAHQDKKRAPLKRWIIENELKGHPDHKVGKEDIHYGFVPIEMMAEYAAMDTFLTFALYEKMMGELDMTQDLAKVYFNEIKLCKMLFETEEGGAKIDRTYMQSLEEELRQECTETEAKIHQVLGPINLGSSDQLAVALESQGVELVKKTASGKWSTDKKVLQSLAKDYPVVSDILYLRGSNKILNTYAIGIQDKLDENDHIHMNFNQNVTTGRMSCREPNVQNIPRDDTRIRKAFICPDDHYFVFADYSQVEVRLTAHFSEDPIMLDAYSKNQDIHARTACEMFDLNYDETIEILKDEDHEYYKKFKSYRDVSKTINFGIIYGVGAPGLSGQIKRPDRYIGVPESEWIDACQGFINRYFQKYRGVKRFVSRCSRLAKKHAEIPNSFGRIRHLPHVNAAKIMGEEGKWMAGRAMRQAPNFVIQSTAADIFKFATVRVHEEVFKNTNSKIVNLVHDEIQSYVHKEELHLLNKKRDVMEDFDFLVPLKVDFAYSTTSWAEKKGLAA
jgi:DNA polymerase I-like protein with 3'-5' exonuclease and polymerase domains